MKILTVITYYQPHISGLTIYTQRLARALVKHGHQVTVLTSRFAPDLKPRQVCDGVQVIRARVWMKVSKGVIMPSLPYRAWELVRQADIVHLHLPQFDAAILAAFARMLRKPVVITYHCDLTLPKGFVNRVANAVSNLANQISASLSDVIVTNTMDYAENSTFLQRHISKVTAINPPVEIEPADQEILEVFRQKARIEPGQKIISMITRLAAEKGVEYLVQALPAIVKRFPEARVLYAGQHIGVWGEEAYARKLDPIIAQLGNRWQFLGVISDAEKRALYQLSNVVVVPSLNSTESFSITQVEAMTCGTPVVASDLPGVRQPVRLTGMGRIVPPADSSALSQAVIEVLADPGSYAGEGQELIHQFAPAAIAAQYEQIFSKLVTHAG